MASSEKKGEKMFVGSGWTLKAPGGGIFPAKLREVLHTGKGRRVAIFYVRKSKQKKPKP